MNAKNLLNEVVQEKAKLVGEIALMQEKVSTLTQLEKSLTRYVNEYVDTEEPLEQPEITQPEQDEFEVDTEDYTMNNVVNISRVGKSDNQLDLKETVRYITSVLKRSNEPMKLEELYNKVSNKFKVNVKYSNFRNNVMPRALKNTQKIKRASRGFYTYSG